ncbi:hypothetical protein Slin14017_G065890 [Septoria linicola]|nr:hypothetical protein Slin14017_G065890 [Septoria linicola]
MERGPITYAGPVEDYSEKKQPTTYTTPVTPTEDDLEKNDNSDANSHAHWQPGFIAQFPWLGLGALGGVILCLIASVIVLICSNKQSQTRIVGHRGWPKAVAPNVLISIFNSVANICFGIAISNGVAIAWWRRALKGGTIKDLNQSWQFSSSVKEIALSGKAFNIIALTALVAKMTLIDSTLLQKSIGTYTQTDPVGLLRNSTWGYINETFPITGAGVESAENGAGIQSWFNADLNIWQTGGGVFPNQFKTYDRENGQKRNPLTRKMKTADAIKMATMYLDLTGAGFAFVCEKSDYSEAPIDSSKLLFYDKNPVTGDIYQPNATNFTLYNQQLYGVDFRVHHSDSSISDAPDAWKNNTDYIIMTVLSSDATDEGMNTSAPTCAGTLYSKICRLRPAKVVYPVELTQRGNELDWTADLATDQNSTIFYEYNTTGLQQNYHTIKSYQNISDTVNGVLAYTSGAETIGDNTLGGIASGLNSYLGGYAWLSRTESGIGYRMNATGSAQSYLGNTPGALGCGYQYGWPLDGGANLLGDDESDAGAGKRASKSRFLDPGIIGAINSIMFALSTDVGGSDPANDYEPTYDGFDARVWKDTIHYKSNYWYMGGAIASTIICILCVLPSYWGFWQLGRKVTLGPFEIAAAFRAPNLNHPTAANAPVEKLIEEVGDRRVQFGHIVNGTDAGRIGVAEPENVERVKPKIGVAGEEIRGRLAQTFSRKHVTEMRDA